jgi:hypothetical protein
MSLPNTKFFPLRIFLIVSLILIFLNSPVFGQDSRDKVAWEKLALGLELIIEEKTDEAILVMKEIVLAYPDTEASAKAREYIDLYANKLDRSGIISFYLGNMLTATWVAFSIPMILDLEEGYVQPIAGIVGVGSGIYTSWLMSRNIDMSLGKDLWIEFIEAASVTNFQYAYFIFGDYISDNGTREKINAGGQSITSLASRGLTYNYILDKDPSAGKVFTVINSYAWSQYYLWVSLSEIFNSNNEKLNYSLGMLVPDLAALGTYFLWDRVGWSIQRTGIISVSGLAGLLTGVFVNMIINEAGLDPSNALTSSIILTSSLAGKVIGAFATSGMEADAKADKSLFESLSFMPVVSQHGTGFMMNLSY